jgi:putative spermidine/putrescine transport system permease protein
MPILAALGLFLAAAPLLALCLLGAPGLPALLAEPAWHAALLRTLNLAVLATLLAMSLGLVESLALRATPRRAKPVLYVLFSLPLLCPAALLSPYLQDWADQASPAAHEHALLAAHALPASCLAFLVLSRGLDRMDTILLASLRACGASPVGVWRLGILPDLIPALLSAAAASFAAAMALTMADTALAEAFHPTLGAMLSVSIQTADAQTAPAGLLLAALATAPLILPAGLSLYRRR